MMDRDGITLLLEPLMGALTRLERPRLDAGSIGRGPPVYLGRLFICGRSAIYRKIGFVDISQL